MFSLFQIMTLEAWAEIAREVMARYPAAWLFFITFILVATFSVLNLFIALIVKAMEDPAVGPPANRQPDGLADGNGSATQTELGALRAEIAALRRELAGIAADLPRSPGRPTP
jgi:voltage-gated sodium channel